MNPRQIQKQQKRETILKAAANVFSRNGFTKTLIADVAAQAGIGKGTLYEYFNSKEELFFAVAEWFITVSAEGAKVSIAHIGGSAAERFEALSSAVVRQWNDMKDMFSLYMEVWAVSTSGSPQLQARMAAMLREVYRQYREILAALVRDGVDRGEFGPDVDPEAVAAVLVGAWDALFLQAWFDPEFDPIQTAEKFMKILMRGLTSTAAKAGDDPDGGE